ncbi:MAG TPA: DUF72 domain-containing protein [Firmicutes bacterium]|nr:DUF72 domain-containing protein [Bacillota bacterium]
MIYIGTSGYSYKDWTGKFYPQDLKKDDELIFYSNEFSFVEINYTFYRIPFAGNLANMAKKVPDNFKFALKLHQSFTHQREYDDSFREALKGCSEKFSVLLAQFPYSFKLTSENKDYLLRLREHFWGFSLSFEFRHDSWATLEAIEFIKKENLSFVAVDEPFLKGLLPPIVLASSSIGYARFHGRNKRKWWDNNASYERYTYEYSIDELNEWLPRLKFLASRCEKTYIAFNNHYNAGAVRAARLFKELLKKEGLLTI